jgi:hypothetical protein
MHTNYEESMINQHVTKVQVLATKALSGNHVKSDIQKVINEARDHFSIVKSSEREGNLLALKGKLKRLADSVHESHPDYRNALEYAASLVEA